MAEVPSLYQLDISNGNPYTGTIKTTALTIGWLQQGIDLFYSRFPWASTISVLQSAFTAHQNFYNLPTNFIMDVRDALLVIVNGKAQRLRRKPLQNAISAGYNLPEGVPRIYTLSATTLLVAPTPDQSYPGHLWYYYLPAALLGSSIPQFPSDLTLIEYVRVRAMEWIRAAPPGSALNYAEIQIGMLIKSGLGYEPENQEVPLDHEVFIPGAGQGWSGSSSWLGEVGT